MFCILLGSVTTELQRDSCGERSYTRFICDIRPAYCWEQLPLSYRDTCLVSGVLMKGNMVNVEPWSYTRYTRLKCTLFLFGVVVRRSNFWSAIEPELNILRMLFS